MAIMTPFEAFADENDIFLYDAKTTWQHEKMKNWKDAYIDWLNALAPEDFEKVEFTDIWYFGAHGKITKLTELQYPDTLDLIECPYCYGAAMERDEPCPVCGLELVDEGYDDEYDDDEYCNYNEYLDGEIDDLFHEPNEY